MRHLARPRAHHGSIRYPTHRLVVQPQTNLHPPIGDLPLARPTGYMTVIERRANRRHVGGTSPSEIHELLEAHVGFGSRSHDLADWLDQLTTLLRRISTAFGIAVSWDVTVGYWLTMKTQKRQDRLNVLRVIPAKHLRPTIFPLDFGTDTSSPTTTSSTFLLPAELAMSFAKPK